MERCEMTKTRSAKTVPVLATASTIALSSGITRQTLFVVLAAMLAIWHAIALLVEAIPMGLAPRMDSEDQHPLLALPTTLRRPATRRSTPSTHR
jgi:hypothetical protein